MTIFQPPSLAFTLSLMILNGILHGQEPEVAPTNVTNRSYLTWIADDSQPSANPEGQGGQESAEQAGCQTCCRGLILKWSNYPTTIRPMPRPGIFSIPDPSGPSYFTLYDLYLGNCLEKPRKSGYAPFAINPWPMYDADWRFVEDMDCSDRNFVERLKRIHLNDCWLLSTGGQVWLKYHHEQNSRLTESVNDFTQYRFRMYTDLWYRDALRIYGEFIWADIQGNELAPLPPDVDKGDLHNLFVDLKLCQFACHPVFVRVGRQELLFGSQRMITPLPWANKRHAFDGVKLFRKGEKWDYELFWTQFVPPAADSFDQPDSNRMFAGSWLTYRPEKGRTLDMYYLLFDNDNSIAQQNINRAPFETHTVGSRWSGDRDGKLWDVEGAMQFGNQGNNDVLAGMATAGVGRHWKGACWNPTAWIYYDYASGDSDPESGSVRTYNQQFPFGHYYLGWADAVGRQNIHDLNAHLYLFPAPWCTVWLQYHHFWLAQSQDALYNAGGAAIRRDPTGASGRNVGDELNLVMNFRLNHYSDVLVSYNKLFGGSYLRNTAGANQAVDTEACYLLFQQRW